MHIADPAMPPSGFGPRHLQKVGPEPKCLHSPGLDSGDGLWEAWLRGCRAHLLVVRQPLHSLGGTAGAKRNQDWSKDKVASYNVRT